MNFMSLVSGQMLASPTLVGSVLKFVCMTHHSANLVHEIKSTWWHHRWHHHARL